MIDLVEDALAHLSGPGFGLSEANQQVPAGPGLYSLYAIGPVWRQLGLGDPPDDRPLYVGKSESSLIERDVQTHFATGHTGHSTVRRSLAGLLREQLALPSQPRNVLRPGHCPMLGLEASADERLSVWMARHLTPAVWPAPPGTILRPIETAVYKRLCPPLNLVGVKTQWRLDVEVARATLADEARAWRPS